MLRPPAWRVVAAAVTVLLLTRPAPAATGAQVEASLNKAKEFLYSQMKPEGNWELVQRKEAGDGADMKGAQFGGLTSIATYAMLAAGEDAQNNPKLKKAVDFLRTADINGVYALGMRMQVWLLLPKTAENKAAMLKDANLMLNAVKTQGGAKGYYNYTKDDEDGRTDRSVSQYGVLGMWAAAQMNVEVPTPYWEFVEKAWRKDQFQDGWSYEGKNPPTPAMTAAGIATLFIIQDQIHGHEGIDCKGNFKDPQLDKSLTWMGAHNKDFYNNNPWPFYTLYGVERIGVASGYRYFGTFDWYREGANWLLAQQQPDGGFGGGERVINTAFSMLFLTRGRAPVMMNKLEYTLDGPGKGAEARWNNRPRDAANIAHWMSNQLERYINWQIVNFNVDPDDWLDAPILYIAGNQPFTIKPADADKIKRFVEQGGLVLANADCNTGNFANTLERLGEKLFPGCKFRDLPQDHVLLNQPYSYKNWRAKPLLRGLSNGSRELMLVFQAGDPAKLWQVQSFMGQSQGSSEIAANIFLYTASRAELRHKDETYLVKADPNVKPEKSVKIARLMYDGKDVLPDPEPGGWRRLAALSHNRYKVDLDVAPVTLGQGKLSADTKVAHLTGTRKFDLSPKAADELKKWVDAGGTLIIDACGGNTDFAESVERQIAALFPPAKAPFPVLAADHPLYTATGSPTAIEYRPYAKKLLSGLGGPRVRGIEINSRTAVYFSTEDLSTGLVGQAVDGVYGYTPNTASTLMLDLIYQSSNTRRPPPSTAPATAPTAAPAPPPAAPAPPKETMKPKER
jgi:hypothetical protein